MVVPVVQLLQAFLLALDIKGIEAALPDTIAGVAVNGGRQAQARQHPPTPGILLMVTQSTDNALCGSLLQL
jgi:hypothetical protein